MPRSSFARGVPQKRFWPRGSIPVEACPGEDSPK